MVIWEMCYDCDTIGLLLNVLSKAIHNNKKWSLLDAQ